MTQREREREREGDCEGDTGIQSKGWAKLFEENQEETGS